MTADRKKFLDAELQMAAIFIEDSDLRFWTTETEWEILNPNQDM